MRAQASGDGVDDVAKGSIACRMYEVVVDGLEVVDVDEGDGEALAAATGTSEFCGELLLDAAAIKDAGEQVAFGFIFDESEKVGTEHQEEREADEEDERDAEQDGDDLQHIQLHRIRFGARDKKKHG